MASATRSRASIPDHLTKEEVRITILIANPVRPALRPALIDAKVRYVDTQHQIAYGVPRSAILYSRLMMSSSMAKDKVCVIWRI